MTRILSVFRVIYFPALLMTLWSCTPEKEKEMPKTVYGKVYDGNLENVRLIKMSDNPMSAYADTYFMDIAEDSTFSLDLDLDGLTTGAIISGDYFHYVALMPDDELKITLFGDSIWFEGKGSERNNYLKNLEKRNLWGDGIIADARRMQPTLDEFVSTLERDMKLRADIRSKYDLKEPFLTYARLTDSVFYFTSLRDYALMSSLGSEVDLNKVPLPERMDRAFDERIFINDSLIPAYRYTQDIIGYIRDLSRSRIGGGSQSLDSAMWAFAQDSLTGDTRDYVLASMFNNVVWNTSRVNDSLYQTLKKDISNLKALSHLDEVVDKHKEQQATLGKPLTKGFEKLKVQTPDGKEMSFNEMMASYAGKVVYLNVWLVDWYPDFPYRPKFHLKRFKQRLQEEPIEVVQLAISDKSKFLWEHIQEMSDIQEDQYYLLNPQDAEFLNFYEIGNFPYFFVIDKKGNLRAYKAPGPPTATFSNELADIEKALRALAAE